MKELLDLAALGCFIMAVLTSTVLTGAGDPIAWLCGGLLARLVRERV